ncbi:MAG TPA: PQQ-dependent sugar dehydrogenase [Ignavibacteriaceae bacterium]|nr:PQQ-dependent sugar dehydrogenase [Ignavibacteriaceae bacterium]HRN25557.1 PQQ-dependent sugar dehydrogenase [Ignavibacteriaceae bacterium]HRP92357.1 PQQ-dependent sugar dehydrogenase [Ignavibacteriaceae bacterium]HRQ53100.1 PQQ-dependent sugar dehydrogenase [Ignavibacteriaceae bacterium]
MTKTKTLLALLILLPFSLFAQYNFEVAFPNLSFSNALDLQNAGDGSNRLFAVERDGRIKVFQNQTNVNTTKLFLDITDRVTAGGETGLLGLAFHPNFENNGYFYVNYTAPNPLHTVISRFQVSASNPDSADKNSELILLTYNQPYSNHNGGCVAFGNDGYLYISAGDGGSGGDPQGNAQNITKLLGKIIRIDVNNPQPPLNYGIPSDNPFVDSTNVNVRKEIFAWGMRNAWRFSFDPNTGWLWAGDVGQDSYEEVDIIQNGKNYGWRCYEGNHPYNLSGCNGVYEPPIWEYSHSLGYSITGGYVYRGQNVPELYGKYIYGDYGTAKVWSIEYDGVNPAVNTLITTAAGSITSFGVDENKELYLVSFNGKIYRFIPTIVPVELVSFTATIVDNKVKLDWFTATETNNSGFEIQRSKNGSDYQTIFFIGGNGTTTNRNVYSYIDESVNFGVYYYRLKQIDFDGTIEYLKAVSVDLGLPKTFMLEQNYPNPFNPSTKIKWQSPISGWQTIKIYDLLGNEVATLVNEFVEAGNHEVEFNTGEGSRQLTLTSGIYFYQLKAGNFTTTKKMILLR